MQTQQHILPEPPAGVSSGATLHRKLQRIQQGQSGPPVEDETELPDEQ